MLIKCLSFGAPTLTDQYPFDAQKRKTGMLPSTFWLYPPFHKARSEKSSEWLE
ncbi:hypothetical protein [Funiculus sociatus]|uniref:hypothetical protein n=1 Tax=Funiculus sociatus TaxID=450527 RepID=UPI001688F949|nr:hypothetical protein [Trichocoleus sp. FACHB-40]